MDQPPLLRQSPAYADLPPTPHLSVSVYLQSLTLRAHSTSELEEWIAAIMAPLAELAKVPSK